MTISSKKIKASDIETALNAPGAPPLSGVGTGPAVTKTTLGLDQVNNTSDANKPVSTAQAVANAAVQAFALQRSNQTVISGISFPIPS